MLPQLAREKWTGKTPNQSFPRKLRSASDDLVALVLLVQEIFSDSMLFEN